MQPSQEELSGAWRELLERCRSACDQADVERGRSQEARSLAVEKRIEEEHARAGALHERLRSERALRRGRIVVGQRDKQPGTG